MDQFGIGEIILIATTVIISIRAFRNDKFFDSWTFIVDRILFHREYYRILSSGFIHVNTAHLVFNMLSLYFFAGAIEKNLGFLGLIAIYFGSLLGGNLFSLMVHRNNYSYRAVGASGAVSGVIFAAIALFPDMKLAFLFLPIPIPGWAFGVGFVLYSMYGIHRQRDHIGHEAHLGGALMGLLLAIIIVPLALFDNTNTILSIVIPALIFIILLLYNPNILNSSPNPNRFDIDEYYLDQKAEEIKEMNKLLEKIKSTGMHSLSREEKEKLKKYSNS